MNDSLRVAVLTPTALPRITGNAITAERWRRALSFESVVVGVFPTKNTDIDDLVGGLEHFCPDIVHAHHIISAGALMLDERMGKKHGRLPLVVSPAGTDINFPVSDVSSKEILADVCSMARRIVFQSQEAARRLHGLLPHIKERTVCVPKSFMWLGDEGFDLRAAAGCSPDDVLFFMPAGIRPVKGNLECLSAVEEAHAVDVRIRVLFAGEALDARYARHFEQKIERAASCARWVKMIPPEAMKAAYRGADVVVNHSVSEGLSNALLEAMASGRPVLASDIPGNRWLLWDDRGIGPGGVLFNPADRGDFVGKALYLARDRMFRETFAANSLARAAVWPSTSDEAQALIGAYRAAVKDR